MSGITFSGSRRHDEVVAFYRERLDAERWLVQPDCTVLQYDNMLFGFCDRERADTEGIITFVLPDREDVEAVYEDLSDVARDEPRENQRYDVYQFFAEDPEGRTVEVRAFLRRTDPV